MSTGVYHFGMVLLSLVRVTFFPEKNSGIFSLVATTRKGEFLGVEILVWVSRDRVGVCFLLPPGLTSGTRDDYHSRSHGAPHYNVALHQRW